MRAEKRPIRGGRAVNAIGFAIRGVWHFRKAHAGVLASAALGAMVLLGALIAGDSVRETLRSRALARVGKVETVVSGNGRFFRSALADEVSRAGDFCAPVLMLRGSATVQQGGRSIGRVDVVGVDERFWRFAPESVTTGPEGRDFHVNGHLAECLGLRGGETLVLRFGKPSLVAADAPLAGRDADMLSLAGAVTRIRSDGEFGGFSLENTQLPQCSVFVPLGRLQEISGLGGRANLLLLESCEKPRPGGVTGLLESVAKLDDYGIRVVEVPAAGALEIRSSRVFFDHAVAEAIRARIPRARPVITYLANSVSAKGRATPYSMVTAADPAAADFMPPNGTGAVVNEWLAKDLGVAAGDEVGMTYYAVDAGNQLIEKQASFRIDAVVPLSGLAADRMWMPDFPGVAEAESTSDWDAGVPIDLKRIRDKDEQYWDDHRGTPKMFLPLAAGERLFGNRWGEFTALRVTGMERDQLEAALLDALAPRTAGWSMNHLRAESLEAAKSPVDFAGLFVGMSLFLMVSAVSLTAMMFVFQVGNRERETGVLTAIGVAPGVILRWRLIEGGLVVLAGGLLGALLALGYAKSLLWLLASVWGGTDGVFRFHVCWSTLAGGLAGFVVLMMLVIGWSTRVHSRAAASLRIERGAGDADAPRTGGAPWLALVLAAAGLATPAAYGMIGISGACFLGGFLWLLAGLVWFRWTLSRPTQAVVASSSPAALARANASRRRSRSLVVVACLACGVFMVVSVAAFRKPLGTDWQDRSSGAGGFAYWVETMTSTPRGGPGDDDPLGLGADRGNLGAVLAIRQGPGDDASCLNLNGVKHPRLLATDVGKLSDRSAFSIKDVVPGLAKDWRVLRDGQVTRAFVDETTLLWVLKRAIGDRIIYQDEGGVDWPVEIAGTLRDSVFQGCLIIDESRFLDRHPSSPGPRVFLADESRGAPDPEYLRRLLGDRAAVVETTGARLAAFHQVENSYIAVFHLLGGLGVMLAGAGVGLVTARNLRERAGEFAILHALGVPSSVVRRVVALETLRWIRWGLGIGTVGALMPLLATLSTGSMRQSTATLLLLVTAVAANAGFWSWFVMRRHSAIHPNRSDGEGA